MTKTTTKTQHATRTTSDKSNWPRPRIITAQAKSTSFGYPSPKSAYCPPTDADRMAEDVERWDGLS